MTHTSALLFWLVWLAVPQLVRAEEVSFLQVVGESPSIYRRPQIDDQFLIGQARSGEEYVLVRMLKTELPYPFYQVLYHSRVGWIYGKGTTPVSDSGRSLSPAQLIELRQAQRSPDEIVGDELRTLLHEYNQQRVDLANRYRLDRLPSVNLSSPGVKVWPLHFDYRDNSLTIHLVVGAEDRHLRLPQTDRFLFQTITAMAMRQIRQMETCRLVLNFPPGPPAPLITMSRERWENARDLSVDSFWELTDKQYTEDLWEIP